MKSSLDDLLADNRAAVATLVAAADAVPKRDWTTPLAEDKWSSAQHLHHVALTYAAMNRDMTGGEPARLLGTPWKRWLWRLVGLPQILWRHRLPGGIKAPREFRPPDSSPGRAALLAELRERIEQFETAVNAAWVSRPNHRITHPYFGGVSLRQAIVMSAVHTRHHAAAITAAHS